MAEMVLGLYIAPLDLDLVAQDGEDDVRESDGDDDAGNGIDAVKPIHKPEVHAYIGEEEVEIFEKGKDGEVEDADGDDRCFCISAGYRLFHPEGQEIVAGDEHGEDGKENGDEGEVVRHGGHGQEDPPETGWEEVVEDYGGGEEEEVDEGGENQRKECKALRFKC
jgi:hypothetical protein